MTVKPVYVQCVSLAIEVKCWQVIWQGWPHLRAEFKNARFRQSRKHGICRSQQFESSTNGNRGAIFALDAGCADDESSFRARNDVYGVARMQKPQHVMQFDLGRVQAHDLPTDAPELWPIVLGTHAAAIHNNSGIRGCVIFNESFPVTLDSRIFESDGNRFQECAIVHLCFAGNIQSFGEACPKDGFKFTECAFEVLHMRLRLPRGKYSLRAAGFSTILAVPQQY